MVLKDCRMVRIPVKSKVADLPKLEIKDIFGSKISGQ